MRVSRNFAIGLAVLIFAVLNACFFGLWLIELHQVAERTGSSVGELWAQLDGGAALARASAQNISRAYNVLVSLVLTSAMLAIPLTANLYTPKLIEIFIHDRVNIVVLVFFVISAALATFTPQMTVSAGGIEVVPKITLWISFESVLLGWAILIPYIDFVFRFLDPQRIIARISDTVNQTLEKLQRRNPNIPLLQEQVSQKILHLGNAVLRAIGRQDRDVTIHGIRAIEHVITHYVEIKKTLPPAWFQVPLEQFVGLSAEAIGDLADNHTWVERLAQTQLQLGYNAALENIPDAISAIVVVNREIAIDADLRGDRAVLELTIRFLNAYVRSAIKRSDIRALFDVYHEYKELAKGLMGSRPEFSLKLVEYLLYYAAFAQQKGMGFIYDLTSFEVEQVVETAYLRGAVNRQAMLEIFLSFETDEHKGDRRLLKTRLRAGGFFLGRGLRAEEEQLRKSLSGVPWPVIDSTAKELEAIDQAMFFEVTDRQVDIDFLEPLTRQNMRAFAETLRPGGKHAMAKATGHAIRAYKG